MSQTNRESMFRVTSILFCGEEDCDIVIETSNKKKEIGRDDGGSSKGANGGWWFTERGGADGRWWCGPLKGEGLTVDGG